MSFGFGGNNSNSTFGGFGGSNSNSGFGSNTNPSTGGSLFGGNTATSGGFGGSNPGFGSNNNNSPFSANKTSFGTTNTTSAGGGGGGGLFGGNTATSGGFGGGGGFGNTANTGSGFGSNTGGGGLFGQSKPAAPGFGASNAGASLFGNSSATNAASGGFGAANNTPSNPFSSNTNASANAGGGFAFGGASQSAANNNNSGTGSTPFTESQERDGGPNGALSKYQSITFQQPYSAKSFEELRVEDYAQGRKNATTNGQAGGFGQSTGFGNFGATNTSTAGGMFGGNTATSGTTGFGGGNSGAFGNTNTSTGGMFGNTANTGGGLFGTQQSKPASTSLFGTTNATNNTGGFGNNTNTGGGLFGGGGGSGGFGNNANPTTGGGLFGNNNQQQQQQAQNKPAFGGFGATTNNNTTGGFGQNTNTGGGLFGGNSNTNTGAGGLFGQNNQQQQQQQQQQSNPFGASTNTGGGLFGNQNKPATGGLFGNTSNTNTGGGLFGAQNNQQQSNPFGASTNTGGGLFGNQNQNKPPGTGLFGGSANQNTGGGLFGAQNNQQGSSSLFGNNNNAGSSLFGNQNKPATGGLFGNTTSNNTNTGGLSLFGNNQNQQSNTGGGLFGGSLGQNNQNQQNPNTSSLFGGGFGQNNQQGTPQQQNQLHATLTGAPYGNEQLFSSLGAASPPVGPLATPLAGGRAAPRKTPSLLASARLNTPVYSPRAGSIGRTGGYGFSYSTYGTPGSAFTSGSLTPGASSLLRPTGSLGSALTSRLNKSLSTSNLRGDGAAGDGRSLLRPSAFSPDGNPGFQNGSVRKLKIDRSLRTDLFGVNRTIEAAKESDAPGLKKRVSFENAGAESTAEPTPSNALVRTEEPEEEEASPAGLLRAGPERPRAPEMEQVSNGALTTVPEDTEVPRPSSAPGIKPSEKTISKKNEVGDYWTKPAMKDLKHMSRQQLKNVGNFVVGREGVGRIEFGSSVDLTNTPLEDICGNIVKLNPRSATVYENDTDKPAVGKALNVPSVIYLENSWPRSHGGKMPVHAKSGKAYDKHLARLKRVSGTKFLNYNSDTGVWSFTVEHFTTYGLDDDDDDASEFFDESQLQHESSELSDPPQTPTGQHDETIQSVETGTGEVEDTFQFKFDQRSRLSNIPGGFDDEGVSYDYDDPSADESMDEDEHMMSGGLGYQDEDEEDPFMNNDAPAPRVQAPREQMEQAEAVEKEQEMPGSFAEPKVPKSILKPAAAISAFASPEKIANESWEERLQATRSPKKRDRQVLKEMQKDLLRARAEDVIESPFKKSMMGFAQGGLDESYLAQRSAKKSKLDTGKKQLGESQNFRNAMDIMDSIYTEPTKGRKIAAGGKGFEYPYPKRARLSSDEMPSQDAEWHDSLKPSFSNNGIFTYSTPGSAPLSSGELVPAMQGFVGEHFDVRFAKFVPDADVDTGTLSWQKENTTYDLSSSFPFARAPVIPFFSPYNHAASSENAESSIWHLCSILFDDLEHAVIGEYMNGIPHDQLDEFDDLLRLDTLKEFWRRLVQPHAQDGLKRARSPEEKAVYYLTQNDIKNACETLIAAKDFKLAAMVAQLPGSQRSRSMMSEQISAWKNRNDWSEMSEPIRAIYGILAGEVCIVQGKSDTAENRVSEFSFSKRFALSWQQSFALRLFYGGLQSIRDVINDYVSDLDDGPETKKPVTTWTDGKETSDVLFEILTLKMQEQSSTVFDPLTVSGSALNSRLAWQLTTLLNAHNICSSPQEGLDQLTFGFAMELENAGDLAASVWALLHVGDTTDTVARLKAVTAVLNRNGGAISEPDTSDGRSFQKLAQVLHIPEPLIWTAKALYAKAGLHNPALELEWLINAGDVDTAHEILCTTLGPQAVIEQDYDILSHSLQLFPRRLPDGWQRGGQVYLDFVRLVNGRSRQRLSADDEAAMKRLRRGLAEMEEETARFSQVERVAVYEMGKVLDDVVREHHGNGKDLRASGMEDVIGPSLGSEMLARFQQAMGVDA